MKHLRRMNESSANEYQLLMNMRKLMKSNSLFIEMAKKLVDNDEISEETWVEFCDDNDIDISVPTPKKVKKYSTGSSSCGSSGSGSSCGYSTPTPPKRSYGSSSCGGSSRSTC